MAVHTIKTIQKIPVSPDRAWAFFSNPANLRLLTPEGMGFSVISELSGSPVYAGQLIEYTVKPVGGIPLYWMTEITQVKEGLYFIDEQRMGPYKLWHHQHHFKAIPGGVEMTDILHYRNRFWVLGGLAHFLFVKNKLRSLFDYRRVKVEELFGRWEEKVS
ncbi:MAG: SRPBCC family protein [Sphingobacteriales bacterium]|nr:SRPBCC family protein [Sphingobacteriales bacterium]